MRRASSTIWRHFSPGPRAEIDTRRACERRNPSRRLAWTLLTAYAACLNAMKAIGLMKDLEPGARGALPSIAELRDRLDFAHVATVVAYLRAGTHAMDAINVNADP